MPHETTLTNIATAIRTKSHTTALIPVREYGTRIRMLQTGGADDRKIVRQTSILTEAQENTNLLIRCDGTAAYEGRSKEIYFTFKGNFIRYATEIKDALPAMTNTVQKTALESRTYSSAVLVGNKLYVGSTTAATFLIVINTLTGRVYRITGLPNRVYEQFHVVGTKIYCLQRSGTIPSISTIVRIQTTNDTFSEISMDAARQYNSFTQLGTRLFLGVSAGAATIIPFINTDTDVSGTVTGLASRIHSTFFVIANRLFATSTAAVTDVIVITAAGTAPNYTGALTTTTITGLPSRIYNVHFVAGNFLYLSSTSAATTIVRINHTAPTAFTQTGTIANRTHNVFILVGTNVYVGSTSSAQTIIVVNNTNGAVSEITDLPNRAHGPFRAVGTKIYVGTSSTVATLIVINTANNTFSEISSLGNSRTVVDFYLNGTILYLLSSTNAQFVTDIKMVDTTNDTMYGWGINVGGYRANNFALVVGNRLYIGSSTAFTTMPVIDLTTNTLIELIPLAVPPLGALLSRTTSIMIFSNDKIYTFSTSAVTTLLLLSQAVMPHHSLPIYMKAPVGDYTG